MMRYLALALALALAACTTVEQFNENPQRQFTSDDQWQEVYRRFARYTSCQNFSLGPGASAHGTSELYPDLGFAEASFYTVAYGGRQPSYEVRIEPNGNGSLITGRTVNDRVWRVVQNIASGQTTC